MNGGERLGSPFASGLPTLAPTHLFTTATLRHGDGLSAREPASQPCRQADSVNHMSITAATYHVHDDAKYQELHDN